MKSGKRSLSAELFKTVFVFTGRCAGDRVKLTVERTKIVISALVSNIGYAELGVSEKTAGMVDMVFVQKAFEIDADIGIEEIREIVITVVAFLGNGAQTDVFRIIVFYIFDDPSDQIHIDPLLLREFPVAAVHGTDLIKIRTFHQKIIGFEKLLRNSVVFKIKDRRRRCFVFDFFVKHTHIVRRKDRKDIF